MTVTQSIYQRIRTYRNLQTNRIKTLPIVILMPHSACNCRCAMCDIWKGNSDLRQLEEKDIAGLLNALRKFGTQQVLMSGGEALLHPGFFRFCEMLKGEGLRVTLLSTGITIRKHSDRLLELVDDIIVSLDGDETTHDQVRNIPGAFQKLRDGVRHLKNQRPAYPVTARTVIHRLNFQKWPAIIRAATGMGLDRISFLPADVSSHAFNREVLWTAKRQEDILPAENELPELKAMIDRLLLEFQSEFDNHFIAERPEKLKRIYTYYAAFYGLNPFPYKKCNAPWVSTVIEADGTVRPCFFHPPLGNIRDSSLEEILNREESIRFRKDLDMDTNHTCVKCVCFLNLSAGTNLNQRRS